jgi:hypothetical protein
VGEFKEMYTILIYPGGRQTEALVLSASEKQLRVVVPGRRDTLEFRAVEGRWVNERGISVELAAVVALGSARQTMHRALTATPQ